MAEVYKFKVKLQELENMIWRDIEITSVSSVAKLGYSVLAAFESAGSHLFSIRYKGKRYEIMFEEDDFGSEPVMDPMTTKLSDLKLTVGDTLRMEYDYGAGWEFSIELMSVTEMKRGTGNHYPYITDGAGKGMIEDTSPAYLAGLVRQIDKTGNLPQIADGDSGKKYEWDYRKFDLEDSNMFYKDMILNLQYIYEEDGE